MVKDENQPVPEWVAEEIRNSWREAREANGQSTAFQILERMVDRLGYGRRYENNPPLMVKDVLQRGGPTYTDCLAPRPMPETKGIST